MNSLTMADHDDLPVDAARNTMRAATLRVPDGGISPHAQTTIGPRAQATTHTSPACILLVDDDAAVRETLADLLELEGYRVLQAGDILTALGRLEREAVDLLITDLSMPGGDGVSLIRQGKAVQRGLPAILLTGYAEEPGLVSASAGTQFHVLSKPVEANHLLTQISLLMHPHRA